MTAGNRLAMAALLLASSAAAADQPPCNSKLVGHFWPEEANTDHAAMEAFVHSGDLAVCSRTTTWRYRWEHLTVNLTDLKNKAENKAIRVDGKTNKIKAGG